MKFNLASMIWAWNYKDLPVSLKHLLTLSALVVLAFWAQSGFALDLNHALFLSSNYLTWFLLLPAIHQLVVLRAFRDHAFIFPDSVCVTQRAEHNTFVGLWE